MRNSIAALAPATVNRIAAGEVVERPASVLKELIENALDAGAGRVELEVAGGGIALIRVSDDGHGIPREELALALERHSTSKIRNLEDLVDGATLGFRGEALAAIASVSLLDLSSRIDEDESAWSIESRGGAMGPPQPRARSRGTTVTVRELFGDVPARRKFLRSEAAEKRALLGVWQRYALAYPEVEFVLREEGRELDQYPATEDLRERAALLLGSTTARHMVEVDHSEEGYRLTGLVSLPLISRGNRSHQFLWLGRRPIQDAQVTHAIGQAYGEVLAPSRFPATLLFLEAPEGQVDVNVHPAKREVRFRQPRLVHHLISEGLRKAIGSRGDLGAMLSEREDMLVGQPLADSSSPLDERARAAGAQRGLADGPDSAAFETGGVAPGARQGDFALGDRRRDARDDLRGGADATSVHWLQLADSMAGEGQAAVADRTEERLFWQLHSTFILTQIRGALVIIDQHNAHERVIFDRGKEALAGRAADSQRLLFPHTVEMGGTEMAAYREQAEFFKEMGFLIEEFGPTTLSVHGIPDTLQRWDGGQVLRDVLDDVMLESGGPSQRRNRALMSFSCKSAIKAGEPMRAEEMRHLVDQLFATENPYTCPHGRPIVIRLSMDELEKRFRRRVPSQESS